MAAGESAYLANGWLGVLGGIPFPVVATLYGQLHYDDPQINGTSHISAGDSTRKLITLGAPASGLISVVAPLAVWANGGASETIKFISFWNAPSGGNFLFSWPLVVNKAWVTGEGFTLSVLTISQGPLASNA